LRSYLNQGLLNSISFLIIIQVMILLICGAYSRNDSYANVHRIIHFLAASRAKCHGKKVMIVGAGEAGAALVRALNNHVELGCRPVVLIDDDRRKLHSKIGGIPVSGDRNAIKQLAIKNKIDEIIVAIPSVDRMEISDILQKCKEAKCSLKILSSIYESADEGSLIKHLRAVTLEDLLGREEVKLDKGQIAKFIQNEAILVIHREGRIELELCRQINEFEPKELLILDISEGRNLFAEATSQHKLKVVRASALDKQHIERIFRAYRPTVVIDAAAVSWYPTEAIKLGIAGSLNAMQYADEFGAKHFLLLTTDAADKSTCSSDTYKRTLELTVQYLNSLSKTRFTAVRLGNILGSEDPEITQIKEQIRGGGPVTVVHPNKTRYLMTEQEAAKLVIQAGAMARGGELFILDKGECIRSEDLVRNLIQLEGLKPDEDIQIEYTGLGSGERVFEELHILMEEGIKTTTHPYIFAGRPLGLTYKEFLANAHVLADIAEDDEFLQRCEEKVLPVYSYVDKLG